MGCAFDTLWLTQLGCPQHARALINLEALVNLMSHDVVIIGAGPAGVSAAWPLVKAGLSVLMLDQGRMPEISRAKSGSFGSIRNDPQDNQWREFIGDDFSGIGDEAHSTPKMKVPQFRYVQRGYEDAYGLSANNVRPTGSLAAGGLSNMWGAGAYCYNDEDLAQYPIGAQDLMPSYKSVAERIGISGVLDDDIGPFLGDVPLQKSLDLCHNAQSLLSSYELKKDAVNSLGFVLGRTRNAVLTKDRKDRSACTYDNMCLWGCKNNSIYSASQDLALLQKEANFTYQSGAFVHQITSLKGDNYSIECSDIDSNEQVKFSVKAKRICLAAGTIGSTILAMDMLKIHDTPLPILSHPAMAFAFILPQRVGMPETQKTFALGHLAYRLGSPANQNTHGFGIMFAAEGLLAADLAAFMPLSRPAAAKTIRTLLPAMVVANCYVPSVYSDCTISVSRGASTRSAHLEGGVTAAFENQFKEHKITMRKAMQKIGAYLLPGGAKRAELGSDGHFAGGIPMMGNDSQQLSALPSGEIRGLPNVYSVDGAALTSLSGKHPTFTIMGNADRIARGLAHEITRIK